MPKAHYGLQRDKKDGERRQTHQSRVHAQAGGMDEMRGVRIQRSEMERAMENGAASYKLHH